MALLLAVAAPALSTPATAADVVFEEHVRPLLKAHCFTCHGEAEELAGGLDLRLVRLMRRGGESGPAVVPGDPEHSALLQRVADGEMPPDGQPGLTPAQVNILKRWIAAGAPTRRPEPADATPSFITDDDRAFWSFQPLERPTVPDVIVGRWPAGPIDRFVLAGLESAGLPPASQADPRTRLRRLSFLLTGLPPTADEVAAFEQDSSPPQYAAAVERLLASPHFGERWARVWLDLARYADETPNYLNSADQAWLYRDWVIRAFNEDRPYDDFVRQQLAADKQPDAVPENLAALGFLGLSPTYWKELQLAPDVIKTVVADEWDERIDAVTRTFLGLTVSCARCHHHKFDPVTVQDYYALAGIMASTRLAERPLLSEAETKAVHAARKQVAAWEAEQKSLAKQVVAPTDDGDQPIDAQSAILAALPLKIADLKRATPHYDAPAAHIVEDASLFVLPDGEDKTRLEYRSGMAQELAVFRRGNPADPGEVVPRRFLEVLCDGNPQSYQQGSGRAELAESIVREGGPLAARVIVNRTWEQLFGRGLVSTPSDFGRQGERPTHPELLEYLAARLVEEGWSLKPLIREIVLSATFQQESRGSAASWDADPDARWLSRYPRQRLDIEAWRDALLAATGVLDERLYGPATPLSDPAFVRRTYYGKVVREELDTVLRLYDFPEPTGHSPTREATTTPLQQLFVLNGPLIQQLSRQFAASLAGDAAATPATQIDRAYQRLLQRPATLIERERGVAFLQSLSEGATPTPEAWSAYIQALFGLNEVMFLD